MYSIFSLLFLIGFNTRCILCQIRNQQNDVIWFPIEGISRGYYSSLGDVYLNDQDSTLFGNAEQWEGRFGWEETPGKVHQRRPSRKARSPRFAGGDVTFPDEERILQNANRRKYERIVGLFHRPQQEVVADDLQPWDPPKWKRALVDTITFPGPVGTDSSTGNGVDSPDRSRCLSRCPKTPEYNPVCGSDFQLYSNPSTLRCERICGSRVTLLHYGVCGSNLPLIFKPAPRKPSAVRPIGRFAGGGWWR